MRLATLQITYDEALVGIRFMTDHVGELEGVVEVYEVDDRDLKVISSLSEPAVRWRVEDNITGAVASRPYDGKDIAEHICAGLNTPEEGGRYGVYTNSSGEWRRDLT
jgi:hypothetical protein